ncbi:hypothetical protein [Asanoa siamensis]|uniref:Uncharacterized protein n=1 Tax=Asanoa siamensis TaxID=926357 RepID=A0ABQ4CY09_9ACTN|nr:hypothetical protein [Asanoa siamensis]GIF76187.1 hypothetical protein Asi02nite_57050 [Asanoa siamensis]
MLRDTPDGPAIRKATDRLLRAASASGRFPTPVDDIVAAAGLTQPAHSMLSELVVEKAPAHIQRAMRKLKGKVHALLDREAREIHIDPSIQNQAKIDYRKLHEVVHDALPWQKALAYADDAASFAPSVRRTFEWQANQGAAELLFQGDVFADMADDYRVGMATVLELASIVGSSGHAAFVRYVETHRATVAGVVLDLSPCGTNPLRYRRREVVYSAKWQKRFGDAAGWPHQLEARPYLFIESIPPARRGNDAVPGTLALPDLRNESVTLATEVYCNQYKNFALIWLPRRELFRRARIIAPRRVSLEV